MPNKNTISKKSKKGFRPLKAAGLLGTVLVVVACVLGVLELTHTIHLFNKSNPVAKVIVTAGKSTPKPQNNVSNSTSSTTKSPSSTSGNLVASTGTDTNGTASTTTSPSQWVTSASGNITVKQPTANSTIQSGFTLSGSAKISTVNYRLIDNSIGVVSEGTLNVVNGNFSGTINFTPSSSTGRLDVFSTDSQGVELNEVQISVNF